MRIPGFDPWVSCAFRWAARGAVALIAAACSAILGTHSLLGSDPISTSADDTDSSPTPAEGLELAPTLFRPLLSSPRTARGAFILRPGAYAADLRSYCLLPGSRGPNRGDGYLFAPLKGERAAIVRSILAHSEDHRDIPQTDVQLLLWSVLARTKPEGFMPGVRAAAGQLLSPTQLLELEGGALGILPQEAVATALSALPRPVAAGLRASNEMRALFARGNATYEDIERIAVLPPGPASGRIRRGQWSRHPGGFFVRYLPEGYSRTRVEILVPWPADSGSSVGVPATTAPSALPTAGSASDAGPGGAGVEYDPSGDVAMPANSDNQRLGMSPAPVPVFEASFPWETTSVEGEGGGHRCADTWAVFVRQAYNHGVRCTVEVCVPYSNHLGSVSESMANEYTAIAGAAAGQRVQQLLNSENLTAIDACDRWKSFFRNYLRNFIPGSTVSAAGTSK